MSAIPVPHRHLCIHGTRNLRDIGGYATVDGRRTRWQTVLRSDCPGHLSAASKAEIVATGIRSILDLREADEVAALPNDVAGLAQVSYHWLPLWDNLIRGDQLPEFRNGYRNELDYRGEHLASICQMLLQDGGLPALIHCTAGKDRTGLVVALLLALARVPSETIIEDYTLSAACLGQDYVLEGRQWLQCRGGSWEQYGHLYAAPPERMRQTLDHLERRWGGAEAYLVRNGLTRKQIAELHERLTEAAPFTR